MLPSWLDRLQRAALLLTAFLYSAGYATAGLALILLTVVLEGITLRRLPWRRSPLDLLLCAFMGVFVVSGALSNYRAMALGSVGLAALTLYLAFGLTHRVLRRDPDMLMPILWVWLIGGMLTAAWLIVLHLQTGAPASTLTMGQNAAGTTMVITAVVALGLAMSIHARLRYLAVGISLLAGTALLFTYSRGAWLGLVAGLALMIGLGGRKVALASLLAGLVVVIVGAAAGGERSLLANRARTILDPSVHQSRIFLLRSAVTIFTRHPIMGTGLNTFPLVYPQNRLPGDVNPLDARPNAHNIVLNMAAEGGVLGLGVFLALLGQTFLMGWRWRAATTDGPTRGLRTALMAALAGMLVHQLFDGTLLSVHIGAGMWMIMAMLTAFHRTDA